MMHCLADREWQTNAYCYNKIELEKMYSCVTEQKTRRKPIYFQHKCYVRIVYEYDKYSRSFAQNSMYNTVIYSISAFNRPFPTLKVGL